VFDGLTTSDAILSCDSQSISARALHQSASLRATFTPGEVVKVRAVNSIETAIEMLSVLMSGAVVNGVSSLMQGYLSDVIDNEIGKSTVPFGGVLMLSSGTTGRPALRVSKVIEESDHWRDASRPVEDFFSRVGAETVFVRSPMATSFPQFLTFLSAGVSVLTTQRVTDETHFQHLIDSVDVATMRPSMAGKLLSLDTSRLKGFMNATGPVDRESEAGLCEHGAEILDAYVTTEAGLIGYRILGEEQAFTMPPFIDASSVFDGMLITSWSVGGTFVNGSFLEHPNSTVLIPDSVSVNNSSVRLLGRAVSKPKVSGFTIPTQTICDFAIANGCTSASMSSYGVFDGSDIMVLEYESDTLTPDSLSERIKMQFPKFYVPSVVRNVAGSVKSSVNGVLV